MTAAWTPRYARNTTIARITVLRKILRSIDHALGTNHLVDVGKPPGMTARVNLVSPAEYETLLAKSPAHIGVLLRLMRVMGLRWMEAYRASPSHYDGQRKTLAVKTKGGTIRLFRVPPELRQFLLANSQPGDERSYTEILRGKHLTHRSLHSELDRVRKKAGVSQSFRPHDLRRTAAVELYERTHDIFQVKRLLGHNSVITTAWYLKAYDAKLSEIHAAKIKREDT